MRFDSALPDAAQNETVTALLDELSGVADDAGFVLHATGAPIFGAVTDGYFRRDLGLLTPTATGSRSTHVVAGIYLDVGTAMIASIVLGVSVDDTVYFLTHYRDARRRGADVRAATAHTFAVGGRPALFTAALLAARFFVLGFSKFQSLANFGVLSGSAVLIAFGAELLLMPAVLELAARRSLRGPLGSGHDPSPRHRASDASP